MRRAEWNLWGENRPSRARPARCRPAFPAARPAAAATPRPSPGRCPGALAEARRAPRGAADAGRRREATAVGDVGRCLTALSAKNAFLVSSLYLPSFGLKPFPLVLSQQTLSGGRPQKILSWISQRHGLSQAYPESQKGAFKTKSSSAAGAWGAQLTQLQGFPKLQRHCAILPLRDFTCLPCSLKAFVMHSCSLTFVGGVEVKHSISFRASEDLPEPLCWSFCSAAFLVATHLMCGFVPLMQVDLHISCFQEPDYDRYGAEGWFIPILTHYGSLNWNVKGWRA